MRPIGFGCQEHGHHHEVIVAGRPVFRVGDDQPRGLVTLWRCPVVDALGGYWHDLRHRPEDQHPTHPDLNNLPSN